MCLAQGHNTVNPVRLEPTAPRSQVKHSTSEPLCSLQRLSRLNLIFRLYHTTNTSDLEMVINLYIKRFWFKLLPIYEPAHAISVLQSFRLTISYGHVASRFATIPSAQLQSLSRLIKILHVVSF